MHKHTPQSTDCTASAGMAELQADGLRLFDVPPPYPGRPAKWPAGIPALTDPVFTTQRPVQPRPPMDLRYSTLVLDGEEQPSAQVLPPVVDPVVARRRRMRGLL